MGRLKKDGMFLKNTFCKNKRDIKPEQKRIRGIHIQSC